MTNPRQPSSLTVVRTVRGRRAMGGDRLVWAASEDKQTGGRSQSSLPPHCLYGKHVCHYQPARSSRFPAFTWWWGGGRGARGVLTCVPQPREGLRPSGQDSGSISAAWHRLLAAGHVTTPRADQLTHNAMLLRKPLQQSGSTSFPQALCDKGETTPQEMSRLWLLYNKSTETAVGV